MERTDGRKLIEPLSGSCRLLRHRANTTEPHPFTPVLARSLLRFSQGIGCHSPVCLHLMQAGHVARPALGQNESKRKDYVKNVQGFVRGRVAGHRAI